MPDFKIFTESKADIKFISDYILEHFKVQLTEDDFYALNSWSGYKSGGDAIAAVAQNHDNGKQTILILDADNNFADRQAEVIRDFKSYNIPIQLFLFPDNNSAGSLETVLCEIAVKQDILRCFEGYEGCIRGYESPVIKSKVFAYLDALLPFGNKKNDKHDLIQEAKRNYRNTTHWNLHHDYLTPLYTFLIQFFK